MTILEKLKPKLPGILKTAAAVVVGGVLTAVGIPGQAVQLILSLFGG